MITPPTYYHDSGDTAHAESRDTDTAILTKNSLLSWLNTFETQRSEASIAHCPLKTKRTTPQAAVEILHNDSSTLRVDSSSPPSLGHIGTSYSRSRSNGSVLRDALAQAPPILWYFTGEQPNLG
ncbi:hypothetical protein N7G274_004457 [Stereocaulon virgatum]|uniref:Uncharacterized protein n=1 Tax=Stereocaulon virgatum TaxID=373712 RepID=A0ABR4AH22_9LECA